MKQLAFAIYDRAASAYSQPFFQHTRGLGERAFADAIAKEDSVLHQHPGDYDLFCIGSFDNEDGSLESTKPQLLITGIQVLSLREVANG